MKFKVDDVVTLVGELNDEDGLTGKVGTVVGVDDFPIDIHDPQMYLVDLGEDGTIDLAEWEMETADVHCEP